MIRRVIKRNGKRFVMIEERELRRLENLASSAKPGPGSSFLPDLPPSDEDGNRSAVAYARVSIARSIIKERRAAGLSQQELARLAGLRPETISRLESGKHSPTVRTVEKIDRVLQRTLRRKRKKRI